MSDQITYEDKADLIVDTTIDDIFKVSASDMNEIKNVVNSHADDIDVANNNINDLNNNKLDVDAVLNQASTDTDKPYSADYLNDKLVSVGTTAPENGERIWFAKSANLFNKSLTPFYNYDATYTELATGVKATLTSAGTNKYFAMRLDATKVLGKTLNLSATITPSGTNNGAIRFYFSNNSSLTSIINGRLTTTGSVQVTFPSAIPSGSNGVAIVFSANLNSTTSQVNNYVEYTNVMLQEGSTSYEPYVEPSINVDGEKWYTPSFAIKTKVYPSVTTSDTGYYNLNLLCNEVAIIGMKHDPVESATKIELHSNQLGQTFIRVSVGSVYSARTITNLTIYYI